MSFSKHGSVILENPLQWYTDFFFNSSSHLPCLDFHSTGYDLSDQHLNTSVRVLRCKDPKLVVDRQMSVKI